MKRSRISIRRCAGLALAMYGLVSGALWPVRTSTATRRSEPLATFLSAPAKEADKESILAMVKDTSLQFIENQGQIDSRVAFYVQGRDKTLYFGPKGITFALTGEVANPSTDKAGQETAPIKRDGFAKASLTSEARRRWAVKLDFVNADSGVRLLGEDPMDLVTSYFKGSPDQSRTGLLSFGTLRYENLWPGIDLVYSGDADLLKYQFEVRPGADPRQIKLAYRGASSINLDEDGQLQVTTPVGQFHDDRPYSYQEIAGQRVEVKTAYELDKQTRSGSHAYSFHMDAYDKSQPLIIDPAVLINAGYIGGAGDERGLGIAVDAAGNAYVTGATTSTQATFPVAAGQDMTFDGVQDAFIVKVSSTGSGVVYASYIGGRGDDVAFDIAVDSAGNAYVTGATTSTQSTFPVTVGPDLTHNGGNYDAFVAKMNPGGTALVYCGYIGGAGEDGAAGVAVNANGIAYITGGTSSSEATFPVLVGPDTTYNGGAIFGDAFVAKVKATGATLDYCGYVGGSGEDAGLGIAIDNSGHAYIAGGTTSSETTFPVVNGPDMTFNGGLRDAFVAKVHPSGRGLVYAGYVGGAGGDTAFGIAVDAAGQAYIAGDTTSSEASFPVTVGPNVIYNGGGDAFISKINSRGTALLYCGYIGGSGLDGGTDIRVDSRGNAYVTGATASTETTFPVSTGPLLTFNGGNNNGDGFVAKVNQLASLDYCGYVGGSDDDIAYAIALDSEGNAYVTGETRSAQAFAASGGPQATFNGGARDAFIAKIGRPCSFSLSGHGQSFSAEGGIGTLHVKAGIGCAWTASSSSSWIVIDRGASGVGGGAVNFSVTTNSSPQSRTGTLTVAGGTFTVLQAGAPRPNASPDCRNARPSETRLWPPNGKMVSVSVVGVTDPDGDPVAIRIDRIMQDEPTKRRNDGHDEDRGESHNHHDDGPACSDALGIGTSTAKLRAERNGSGNGRVYTIFFTAKDGKGGSCQSSVKVCVPHSQNGSCTDDGPKYDSTSCPGR